METASIILNQILLMFLLSAAGFYLYKRRYITEEGLRTIGNILIHLVLPSVIVKSFLVERTPEHLEGLLVSGIAGIGCVLFSMLVSRLLFGKDPIACFGSSFSNPGFFGVPLVIAALSEESVFYMASYLAALNIGQFTYGVAIMTGKKDSVRPKAIVTAPFFLATVLGLALFFLAPPIPDLAGKALDAVTAVNMPLAMFTIGCYLAAADVSRVFRKKEVYLVTAARLLLIPLLTMVLLLLFIPSGFQTVRLVLMITAACPVGANVAVYAQLHGRDYGYAVSTVIVSTLFSVLTIPSIIYLYQLF